MNWDELFLLLNDFKFFCFFYRNNENRNAYSGRIFMKNQPDNEYGTYDNLSEIIIPKVHYFTPTSESKVESNIDGIYLLLKNSRIEKYFTLDKSNEELIISKCLDKA
ncbi:MULTISPECIES: hypothetical protein [Phocoenobacter]|uniref:Uncharacterized protein n=1 Tax=Phocoenobacter skyensis TaxID=97481 RepID=A0A1H7YDG2_9PAST|nr:MULTISPECIES: hypothetical protein [Pasteurella]MDP8079731.1 hypothetical protein [Pasteurella skyensis]MDP8085694.1 hypothetical protein [Pasteurella skyensis]MDP8100882.1 hypothetical protein [Pasteurella atlantica]MDP8185463.1 hypothetical protein [Pasteurella skyensis]QLB22296.1 hypothetical protein A6B44_03405 [Pasteurella skyensis]